MGYQASSEAIASVYALAKQRGWDEYRLRALALGYIFAGADSTQGFYEHLCDLDEIPAPPPAGVDDAMQRMIARYGSPLSIEAMSKKEAVDILGSHWVDQIPTIIDPNGFDGQLLVVFPRSNILCLTKYPGRNAVMSCAWLRDYQGE